MALVIASASRLLVSSRPQQARTEVLWAVQVLERIGDIAYRLQLLAGSRLHNVFHVGLLEKFSGAPPAIVPALPPVPHGRVCITPEEVLRSRLVRGHHELLVRWSGLPPSDTSWVSLEEFRALDPSFKLEDKLIVQGGEMSCGA